MAEMKRRRGRPKKEDAKNRRIEIRMTDNELDRLKNLSESTGDSMTDIVCKAIRMYEILKKEGA